MSTGDEQWGRDSRVFQIGGTREESLRGTPRVSAAARNDVNDEQRMRWSGTIRSRTADAMPLPIENPSTETGKCGSSAFRNLKAATVSSSHCFQPMLPVLFPYPA